MARAHRGAGRGGPAPALIAALAVLAGASSARADGDARPPPPRVLSTAPVAIAVPAAAGVLYLPVALTWRLRPGIELGVDAAFTRGNWLGCGSLSTGGWLSVGVVLLPGGGAGFFVAPKVTGRVFDTRGGAAGGWFGCGTAEVATVQGSDGEVGVGADVGWRFVVGPVVLEPRLGVGGAVCLHCVGGSVFFAGPVTLGGQPTPRSTRPVLTLDLELLRVGIRF